MIKGLNSDKNNELIHVHFTSELIKECCSILYFWQNLALYIIVLHDFNLTYYSSIILGSFSILLFPKLCWHNIRLTPNYCIQNFSTCVPNFMNYSQDHCNKPQPIMLNFYLLHFRAVLKNFVYYAQYYVHNYCNYVTVHIQFCYF